MTKWEFFDNLVARYGTKILIVLLIGLIIIVGIFLFKHKNDIQDFFKFIKVFEKRVKEIEDKLEKLDKRVDFVAHGCTRTQLMLLMKLFPDRQDEIVKVANTYFVTLQGDWYMSNLFLQWLKDNSLERPQWFTGTV